MGTTFEHSVFDNMFLRFRLMIAGEDSIPARPWGLNLPGGRGFFNLKIFSHSCLRLESHCIFGRRGSSLLGDFAIKNDIGLINDARAVGRNACIQVNAHISSYDSIGSVPRVFPLCPAKPTCAHDQIAS